MKSITLILLSLLILPPNKMTIKKELDQIYFYIPTKADKYDVRKALHVNENLSKIPEYDNYCDCFSVDFLKHPLLKYIGEKSSVVIWFDKEKKITDSRKISFQYNPNDLKKCEMQLKELYEIFKPISYEIEDMEISNMQGDVSGEGYCFYSDALKYKSKKGYLVIGYRFIKSLNLTNYTIPAHYLFEIIYYENNI